MIFGVQRAVHTGNEFAFGSPHHVEHGVGERLHHRRSDAIASAAIGAVQPGDIVAAVSGIFNMAQRFLESVSPLVTHVILDRDTLDVAEEPIHRCLHDGVVTFHPSGIVTEQPVAFCQPLETIVEHRLLVPRHRAIGGTGSATGFVERGVGKIQTMRVGSHEPFEDETVGRPVQLADVVEGTFVIRRAEFLILQDELRGVGDVANDVAILRTGVYRLAVLRR